MERRKCVPEVRLEVERAQPALKRSRVRVATCWCRICPDQPSGPASHLRVPECRPAGSDAMALAGPGLSSEVARLGETSARERETVDVAKRAKPGPRLVPTGLAALHRQWRVKRRKAGGEGPKNVHDLRCSGFVPDITKRSCTRFICEQKRRGHEDGRS